jgi:transcriptional regulator with XRE-family HTH domain
MARLRIKELAKEQNLKQYEVQEKSGVTAQLLSRYWNNQTQRVELRSLELIAHALGVKAGELIVDEEEFARKSA